MLRSFYYTVKPYLPAPVRIALRRANAARIRARVRDCWPILERAGRRPEGWPGWPDGKAFSFVLTHDVEGRRGVERCRAVAELELELGFRSAFNFIPEGGYEVPEDLLEWLDRHGFEVGVHDLYHDGKLFRHRSRFADHAVRINRHLRRWKAAGFRAGFMLHRLDWLHQLEIEYDASTFDVDPFEPQTDGVETIFPFWVPRPNPGADAHRNGENDGSPEEGSEGGFVELPYTLVQDLNLFIVLGEPTAALWDRKLDWIVDKGGMALLTTHPDYMSFEASPREPNEYSVELYRDFLRRVKERYGGRMHHAVPRDIARFARAHKPVQARPPRVVSMVVYSVYENDNRVRRYAETLARRGDEVSVFSLAQKPEQLGESEVKGVRVHHLLAPDREERGKLDYLLNYARFGWRSFRALQPGRFPQRCDLVHVHNMPEVLVFAALCLKWTGSKLVLDLHDLMPELYQDKFKLRSDQWVPRLLRLIEAWSCRFSDHVIISNHLWKDLIARRSRPDDELTALINYVDLGIFKPGERTRADDRFVIVYPGSLNRHQGLDLAIAAMVEVRNAVPKAELHIYGAGPEWDNLREQARRLGLEGCVFLHRPVPFSEVRNLVANADLGVVPKRADGFGNEAFSTKIMEFMSQGLPVVLSRTKVDSYYFDERCVRFFEPGNSRDLADKIIMLALDSEQRRELSAQAAKFVRANSWDAFQQVYLDVIDRLTRTRVPRLGSAESE